ncbi:LacI family DNA-binding transcriptional regulator [Paenibacillus xerothermodurans]|uniref:Catabolite control protein A n=1 Tax=Paenibacillus xerothermodurans TaxID=1977292 RepID=A0A2W1NGE0_PAEXE|nr:LacI family DNA-binding transcriptional regulator [Paenibacillus xerothermodurans]PZE22750.1 LacI family transcriptional regulator [Paenibacillus xerothermodurans]
MTSSKDVARRAGVSQTTVSRVLNGAAGVKPKTREKVLRAIEELNYRPNLIARSLVTKSTKTIALVSGSVLNPFYAETIDSIIQHASQKGYNITVSFDEKLTSTWLETAIDSSVDGILLSSLKLDDPVFEDLQLSGVPYMLFNRKLQTGGNYVVMDNVLAGGLVARHLLDLGHTRIAYISKSGNISTFKERYHGFTQAVLNSGNSVDADLVYFLDQPEVEAAKAVWKIMNGPKPATAILCANDSIALLCMNALLSIGLKIPEQVSLAGIDNIKLASHRAIKLTSVGHEKSAMGVMAVESLIDMIEGRESTSTPKQIVLMPELVVRSTTCKARS